MPQLYIHALYQSAFDSMLRDNLISHDEWEQLSSAMGMKAITAN